MRDWAVGTFCSAPLTISSLTWFVATALCPQCLSPILAPFPLPSVAHQERVQCKQAQRTHPHPHPTGKTSLLTHCQFKFSTRSTGRRRRRRRILQIWFFILLTVLSIVQFGAEQRAKYTVSFRLCRMRFITSAVTIAICAFPLSARATSLLIEPRSITAST
jgi:Zn ribbon nucleic-acid-binding protein